MTTIKILKIVILSLFIVFIIPVSSKAINTNNNISTPLTDSAADAKAAAHIVQRVYEIQSMDKTNLSASEKRSLRNELKDMKQKADGLSRGVYLSLGAIIIIILLLILILR